MKANDLYLSAVQIRVTDLELASNFYSGLLGLTILKNDPDRLVLRASGSELNIELVKVARIHEIDFPKEGQAILVFECDDLEAIIRKFKEHGIEILGGKPRQIGAIGRAINFRDPFGIVHSMIEPAKKPANSPGKIRIHNVGYYIPDVAFAHKFYSGVFGLQVIDRENKPPIMRDNKNLVDLMMHGRNVTINPGNYPADSQVVLVFSTGDLKEAVKSLNKQNITLLTSTIKEREGVIYIVMEDCYKNPVEIRQII